MKKIFACLLSLLLCSCAESENNQLNQTPLPLHPIVARRLEIEILNIDEVEIDQLELPIDSEIQDSSILDRDNEVDDQKNDMDKTVIPDKEADANEGIHSGTELNKEEKQISENNAISQKNEEEVQVSEEKRESDSDELISVATPQPTPVSTPEPYKLSIKRPRGWVRYS